MTVEKCVFEDCCFGANWCIGPKADDVFIDRPKDPSVDIYLCYFKNCSAVDEIQGALVYPGPLYKQRVFRDNKPIYGVIHITDCKDYPMIIRGQEVKQLQLCARKSNDKVGKRNDLQ